MRLMIPEHSRRCGRFVMIVLTSYGDGESQRHWVKWDTALYMGRINQRRKNKNWRVQWLKVVVISSVSCLLFNPMGWLVSHQSFIFCLLVHYLNLLIFPFLSLLEYTVFKINSRRRRGGSENTSIHRIRRPGASSRWIKWGWQSKKSWLSVIGSWSPWNQELIIHQSRTRPQLPRS